MYLNIITNNFFFFFYKYLFSVRCSSGQPPINLTFALMDKHPGNELFIYIHMKYSNVFLLSLFRKVVNMHGRAKGNVSFLRV